ncbi:MerR family transcriptional regulator [Streptomyces sp. NPDC059582]|uniref:MerR family transcriptional regulator n=1 Tax=Streptomyces sp. NPDC059582 TaxID=3346875 RepID=UPI00369F4469
MRIGELAAKAGVSVRALRYYEEQNLLASERSPGGQRHYPDSAVKQVRLIQEMYQAGLPSKSIAEILPYLATGMVTPPLLERLAAERDRIDQQIDALIATRERLDAGIAESAANAAAGAPCRLA